MCCPFLTLILMLFAMMIAVTMMMSALNSRKERFGGKPLESHSKSGEKQEWRIVHPYPTKSFVDVIRQSVRAMPIDGKNCTDIAAAKYVEQNNKNRRVNSFIISGLPINKSTSDTRLVEDLCRNELGISVDLLSSKLIGKETSNRPRHLLAYVQSRDHAKAVIHSAKELRNSNDNFVRTKAR